MQSISNTNRRTIIFNDMRRKSILPSNGTIEDDEEIRNCLKAFFDNKINKSNAWSMNLIDNFSNLVNDHHRRLKNFQIVGNTLEASAKIYGLRVDTVHTDCVRLASGIGAKSRTDTDNDDSNDESFAKNQEINDQNPESTETNGNTAKTPKKKKKRVRKARCTVTKNKTTINGKLDTCIPIDPLFAKWNSMPGDISSSNRMFTNILQTIDSQLSLLTENTFFDATDAVSLECNENEDYTNEDIINMPIAFNIMKEQTLRSNLAGYKITNQLSDDDDYDEDIDHQSEDRNSHCTQVPDIDMVFDINAEIEPFNENDYQIGYDYGATEVVDEEDEAALKACSALYIARNRLTDLRPVEIIAPLEYSYRPMNGINQFWAGPSHWKFCRTTNARKPATKIQQKKTTVRKTTKNIKNGPLDFFSNDINEDKDFVLVKSAQSKKIKKLACYTDPNPKELKLPEDLKIASSFFEQYFFAPSLLTTASRQIETNTAATSDGLELIESGDTNQNQENEDYQSVQDEFVTDDGHVEAFNESIAINRTVEHTEIGTEFVGAPEMIPKVNIHFEKRAKIIDMKQLKQCSLRILRSDSSKTKAPPIDRQYNEDYSAGAVTFGNIYNTLPKLLTPNMSENLTTSVAFYTILHLCNEHQLRLFKYYQTTNDTEKKSPSFFIREIQQA